MVESRSPQNPADVVVRAKPGDVGHAVDRARVAQRDWGRRPAAERSAALTAAADRVDAAVDELAALIVREVGKPVGAAAGEVARCAAILRYYGQQAFDPVGAVHDGPGLLFTRSRPRGVAGLITPWNFPLAIPVWKAAPALAFGNAVVLKPAPQATACALRLAELLDHLPTAPFTVIPGGATQGQAIADTADLVSFTGSMAVGRRVAAAAVARGVPVQTEMGGQNAAIVLPDADIETVAAQVAGAAMGYAGQKCTATKRVISVGDTGIRDALVAAVEKLRLGDPAAPNTVVGPVIDAAARDRVLAAAAGGTVLTGGTAPDGDGWFVAPTVVDRPPDDHILARDEVFGPICAIQYVEDSDAAVAVANGVKYGLVSAVHTRDLDAALDVASRLDTGMVKVNAPTTGVDFHLPFGGEKSSGYGPREQGKAAREFYTSTHTITLLPAG